MVTLLVPSLTPCYLVYTVVPDIPAYNRSDRSRWCDDIVRHWRNHHTSPHSLDQTYCHHTLWNIQPLTPKTDEIKVNVIRSIFIYTQPAYPDIKQQWSFFIAEHIRAWQCFILFIPRIRTYTLNANFLYLCSIPYDGKWNVLIRFENKYIDFIYNAYDSLIPAFFSFQYLSVNVFWHIFFSYNVYPDYTWSPSSQPNSSHYICRLFCHIFQGFHKSDCTSPHSYIHKNPQNTLSKPKGFQQVNGILIAK